jgi:hypothetical protein
MSFPADTVTLNRAFLLQLSNKCILKIFRRTKPKHTYHPGMTWSGNYYILEALKQRFSQFLDLNAIDEMIAVL